MDHGMDGGPHRAVFVLFAAIFLALVTSVAALAETRTKIASSGSWSLSRVSDGSFIVNGKAIRLSSACVMEATSKGVFLRFIIEPRKDELITVMASNDWGFGRSASFDVTLKSGAGFLGLFQDADGVGNSISHRMGPNTGSGFLYMLAMMGEKTVVLSREGVPKPLAGFPFRGFVAVADKIDDCLRR